MNVSIISVVPSPYQRDLFRAIDRLENVRLQVFYLESSAPDSPWGETRLESWESVLPGGCLGKGRVRSHFNWTLPDLGDQDIVVVNAALTDLTTQFLVRRRHRFAAKAAWLFWGELIRTGGGWAGWVRRFLAGPLDAMDGIIAIGSTAAADYQKRFPSQRIFNLCYYCEIENFVTAKSQVGTSSSAGVRFLFCGQMIHRKGVDLLLASFDRLVGEGLDVGLILVGREASLPGYLEALPAASKARIDFRGFHEVNKLPEIFTESDVFVLPSRHDGWGVVINQAIGAGLPIIASGGVGAAHDLVEDGVNGFVVNAGDVNALTNAMRQLSERELISSMSLEAVRKRSAMTPDSGAQRMFEIFETVAP